MADLRLGDISDPSTPGVETAVVIGLPEDDMGGLRPVSGPKPRALLDG